MWTYWSAPLIEIKTGTNNLVIYFFSVSDQQLIRPNRQRILEFHTLVREAYGANTVNQRTTLVSVLSRSQFNQLSGYPVLVGIPCAM